MRRSSLRVLDTVENLVHDPDPGLASLLLFYDELDVQEVQAGKQ
jgi:hypothetical protein